MPCVDIFWWPNDWLHVFLLAVESKGFKTFEVEFASYTAPLAPISSAVFRDLLLLKVVLAMSHFTDVHLLAL